MSSLWFAPRASVHLTGLFFPPRPAGRRPWFILGGPVFLLLFFYVFAILAAAVFAVWLTLLAVVWLAQLVWLIVAGPFALVHRLRHPPAPPAGPRFVQHDTASAAHLWGARNDHPIA